MRLENASIGYHPVRSGYFSCCPPSTPSITSLPRTMSNHEKFRISLIVKQAVQSTETTSLKAYLRVEASRKPTLLGSSQVKMHRHLSYFRCRRDSANLRVGSPSSKQQFVKGKRIRKHARGMQLVDQLRPVPEEKWTKRSRQCNNHQRVQLLTH